MMKRIIIGLTIVSVLFFKVPIVRAGGISDVGHFFTTFSDKVSDIKDLFLETINQIFKKDQVITPLDINTISEDINISNDTLKPQALFCSFVHNGPQDPVIIMNGETPTIIGDGIPVDLQVLDTSVLNTSAYSQGFYVRRFGEGFVNLKSLNRENYDINNIFDWFTFHNSIVENAYTLEEGSTLIEYSCFTSCSDLPTDLNVDGVVNILDLMIVSENLSCANSNGSCIGDVDGDKSVSSNDMIRVMSSFGFICSLDSSVSLLQMPFENETDMSYRIFSNNEQLLKVGNKTGVPNYTITMKNISGVNQKNIKADLLFPKLFKIDNFFRRTGVSFFKTDRSITISEIRSDQTVSLPFRVSLSGDMCRTLSSNKDVFISYGLCNDSMYTKAAYEEALAKKNRIIQIQTTEEKIETVEQESNVETGGRGPLELSPF